MVRENNNGAYYSIIPILYISHYKHMNTYEKTY